MTIDQLRLSPHNVRTNQEDATATAAMKRSLRDRGQMMPLLVHPMKGQKGIFGVFAGGRRYRSFKEMIDAGELRPDWPIDVVVRDLSDAELTELSLAENFVRRDLRPYEVFAAVVKANRRGAAEEEIAETIGQPVSWVKQSIRLGTLAKPIFQALELGRISVDQASAFAATESHPVQIAAWDALRGTTDSIGDTKPAKIRAAMKVGDEEGARLLRFVGEDAYRDRGGRFELDLFADDHEHRGLILDEPLLRELVDARLTDTRAGIRARAGRDLRFVPKAPVTDFDTTDWTLQAKAEDGPDGTIVLPEGDVVATIVITEEGQPEVSYWWASRRAKAAGASGAAPVTRPKPLRVDRSAGSAIDDRSSPGATQEANAAIREEAGLSPDTIQTFRSLRRVIMRAMLVMDAREHGTVGLDYLVWSQLRIKLTQESTTRIGMRAIGELDVDTDNARDEVAATEASREWRDALRELTHQTFITGEDLVEAFLDYRASAPALKNLAASVVAGLALERSLNFGTYQVRVHDAVAGELRASDDRAIRSLWTPTSTLIDKIPAHHRLAIADPFVERVTYGSWQRLKSADLTRRVLELVTGATSWAKASMAGAAATWVHPLLRFHPEPHQAPIGAELAEAAE